MAEEIATQMKVWTLPLPLPTALLWAAVPGAGNYVPSDRQASVLSLQKFAELRAPGWVCDPSLLERETGCVCPTTLKGGVAGR